MTVSSAARGLDQYKDGVFVRTYSGVQEVPWDIPAEAVEVYLGGNLIYALRGFTFYNLTQLREMDLSVNAITQIEPGAFLGLGSLRELALNKNRLTEITGDDDRGEPTQGRTY